MKNLVFTLIIAIIFGVSAFSQPTLQWASSFNAGGNDQGTDLVVDGNGNVYVAGTSDGSNFASDYLTIKYNSNGDTLWTRRFNGNANGIDEAYTIKLDPMGNVYVTGKSATTTTGYNIITIKYNSSGVQQWVANFDAGNSGSDRDDIGLNMLIDIAGNVYVVGSSSKPGSTVGKGIVIKYNTSGIHQWHTHIGNGTQFAKLIEQNTFGNIIVPTGMQGTDYYYFNIYVINPTNGIVLQIYNQDFDPVQGSSDDMVLDASGNIYVTSTTYNFCSSPNQVHTSKFSYVAPPQPPPSHSSDSWTYASCGLSSIEGVEMKMDANLNLYVLSDYFNSIKHFFYLRKQTSNGGTYWALTQPSATDDTPISLAIGSLSNPATPDIYVTGNTSTGLIKTIKYENDSTLLWSKTYGCGNGIAAASKMVIDDCGNIYITGFSTCNGTYKDVKTIKYSSPVFPSVTVVDSTTICLGSSVSLAANACTGCTYLWSSGQTTPSIIVSPLVTTNYTVVVTNTAGCKATSLPTTITVNPLLIPSVSIGGPAVICASQNATFTATATNGGAQPTYQWFLNNNLVGNSSTYSNPMLANGDQIRCMLISNATCASPTTINSPTITLTVLALPNVQITASDSTTFCQGESVILTANPTGSYLWSTGATTKSILVSTAGNYSVSVMATNGCSAVSSSTSVTVDSLPETPTIFPLGQIFIECQGGSAILTSSFSNSYSWNTGATTQSITVSDSGDYFVVIADVNGCLATSDPTSILCIVLTSEATLPKGFNISPNPSDGSFTVKFFLPEAKTVTQRVLNVLGQIVWTAAPSLEVGEYHREIDLSNTVMPGIYLLETRLDDMAFLRKVEVR